MVEVSTALGSACSCGAASPATEPPPQQQQQQHAAAYGQVGAAAVAQQVAPAALASQADGGVGAASVIQVQNCSHPVVGPIVNGTYNKLQENHGRPTYLRDQKAVTGPGSTSDVMAYFWDERDGASLCGWWLGAKVGGDQAWGYNPSRSMTPPTSGWRVPHNGPADPSLAVVAAGPAGGQAGGGAVGSGDCVGGTRHIMVSGVSTENVAKFINGAYTVCGENHGKPAYKKDVQVSGLDTMLYFWDARDGQSFSGWWFGPEVGGDKVMAHSPRDTQTPPMKGWSVPHNGPADPAVSVMPAASSAALGTAGVAQQQGNMLLQQQQQMQLQKQQQMQLQQQQLRQQQQQQMEAKRLQQQKQQQEQRATLAVRRIIQLMRTAREETFDALKAQLDEVLAKELENCGAQQERIKQEAEQGLEAAKLLIAQAKEAEEKRKAAVANAEALLKELEGHIVEAEEKGKALKEEAKQFSERAEVSLEDVIAAVAAVEEAGAAAKERMKVCTDFITAKGAELKVSIPIAPPGQASAEKPASEKPTFQALLQRIIECTKANETTLKEAQDQKAKATKKASAKKLIDVQDALFDKYASKDGFLGKPEAKKFAKAECDCTLSAKDCDRIFAIHVPEGSKGFRRESFQRLRCAIGIVREKAKDSVRKAAREEKEKALSELKAKLQAKVASALQEATAAEGLVAEAEGAATPLHAKVATSSVAELAKLVEEVDALIEQARESVQELKKTIAGVSEGVDPQLTFWLAAEMRQVNMKTVPLEPRLMKVDMMVTRFRDEFKKKEMQELDVVEKRVLRHVRHHQKEDGLKVEELFDLLDADKVGNVNEKGFLKFLGSCKTAPKEDKESEAEKAEQDEGDGMPPTEELKRLFKYLDEDDEGSVPKERMTQWLKVYMKVAKETVMSTELGIQAGENVRRLDEGEAVEVVSAPQKEETVGVLRVRGIAMKDMAEGWVTLQGSQGSKFLVEGGNLFKVVKETILTASFSLGGEGDKESPKKLKDSSRKLRAGELVEVREWPKKEEASGLVRMKCRVKTDGSVGWVTVVGNQGAKFLELA